MLITLAMILTFLGSLTFVVIVAFALYKCCQKAHKPPAPTRLNPCIVERGDAAGGSFRNASYVYKPSSPPKVLMPSPSTNLVINTNVHVHTRSSNSILNKSLNAADISELRDRSRAATPEPSAPPVQSEENLKMPPYPPPYEEQSRT